MGETASNFRTKSRLSHGALGARLDPKAWKAACCQCPRKQFWRVHSEDYVSWSSMANRMRPSATPPLSYGKPNSALLADDRTIDTSSSNGARKVKTSRASTTRAEKLRRRASPRLSRNQLSSEASNTLFPSHYHSIGGMINQKPLDTGLAGVANLKREEDHHHQEKSRPDMNRAHSSPTPLSSLPVNERESGYSNMRFLQDISAQEPSEDMEMPDQSSDVKSLPSLPPSSPGGTDNNDYQEMFKQPETNPITEEQLINEVRGIYAGLVMVEQKCIEVDKEQTESQAELAEEQWQALISLHRTLLYEHHDFFLASQHPSASPVLQRLAEKYAMPARMWRFGIHSLLELLRQNLPKSLEYMLNFIYVAYSMMTLLLESVGAFRETWIECLGDLARYRMAIEESDLGDREIWAGVSRYWYNQDADECPEVGRIQHHLAVLARADGLQQLFYYTKALVSVQPFQNARESITLLFNPYKGQELSQETIATAFIATHGILFNEGPSEQFIASANHFLSLLRRDIRQLGQKRHYGVYMMSCNFASILQYGQPELVAALEVDHSQEESLSEIHKVALEWASSSWPDKSGLSDEPAVSILASSPIASQGSSLAFHTLAILLDQLNEQVIYPSIHISLAFIWCLALRPAAMQQLEKIIPWLAIAQYLNTLLGSDTDFRKVESETFPVCDDESNRQLPEDFLIRGQVWSQLYYPKNFFDDAPSEDNRPTSETDSTIIPRRQRCIWLGVRIATFRRWITYSLEDRKFLTTELAHEISPIAKSHGNLNSSAAPAEIDAELGLGGP